MEPILIHVHIIYSINKVNDIDIFTSVIIAVLIYDYVSLILGNILKIKYKHIIYSCLCFSFP